MTLHTKLSYWKSGLRILGFSCLFLWLFGIAALFLVAAEVIGIVEEMPGSYKGTDTTQKS